MEALLLAKSDFSKYEWRDLPPKDGAQGRIRLLSGAEIAQDVFNRYMKGYQTLFFAFYADLASPTPQNKVIQAARDAWIKLRFIVPTVASLVVIDDNDVPSLQYYSASPLKIEEWADHTFSVHKQTTIDLDAVRRDVGQAKVPSSAGIQTWMHLSIEETDGPISKFGILLHTHHSPFDGNAVKILSHLYLKELAKALGGEDVKGDLKWGTELSNLVPAAFNILAPSEPVPIPPTSSEEPTFAHPFYGTVGLVMQGFAGLPVNPYGFRARQGDSGWPFCRREEVLFSKSESELVFKKLKGPSSSFTVMHLAHAALAMVAIADNPPTKEQSSHFMNSFCLTDCRAQLQEPYSSREGYPGYALGIPVTRVPVSLFLSETGEPLPLDKDLLAKVVQAARGIYDAHKQMPSRLSFMAPVSDIVCMLMKQAASNNPPPDNSFVISNDGAGEKYLDHTYQTASGKDAVSLTRFFTSLNRPDPGPFFRVSSWNGVLDLSADFNANTTSIEDVQAYLAKWKEFMLLIAEFVDKDY